MVFMKQPGTSIKPYTLLYKYNCRNISISNAYQEEDGPEGERYIILITKAFVFETLILA